MKTKPIIRKQRGVIETMLISIAVEAGYKVTEVSFAEMDRLKKLSRAADAKALAEGTATPEELQKKNDFFPGEIEVLDWSPIFNR